MSSISPIETKRFAQRVNEMGADYWMPRFRGEIGAREGTLSIMVGGEQKVFDRVKPLFDIREKISPGWAAMGMGKPVRWLTKLLLR